jgi:hypothetical protein
LPTLKSTGPLAEVVSSLIEAKQACDKFLTESINMEYGYSAEDNIKIKTKKPRIDKKEKNKRVESKDT